MTELVEIVEEFELLDDWDDRYAYLIELGERLPDMPEVFKTEDNRVKACMSKVWVSAYSDPQGPERIRYWGDCDTSVIKGVLAVLIKLSEDKTQRQILSLDMDELFARLHLDQHLSPNRHVGVYAIFELMKEQAEKLDLRTAGAAQ